MQNLAPIALSLTEKSSTIQTNTQTVNDISTPCLSACVDNNNSSYYFTHRAVVQYCNMSLSVCEDISGTTCTIFTKFFVHAAYGHGLVLLWHRCNTLCTSSFVDDIIFFSRDHMPDEVCHWQRKCCN